MKSFFKKILRWFLWIFLAVIVLLIAGAALFEKPISRQIIKQVNAQLSTELQVADSRLSLIRSFPNAYAELQGVRLEGSLNDELLTAESLAFRFGIFSLLSAQIKIKSVQISDGKIIIVKTNKQGKSNYDIYQSTDAVGDSTDNEQQISLSIDNAVLDNVEIGYLDMQQDQQIRFVVNEGEISGNFSSSAFSLRSKADLLSRFVDLSGTRYAENKQLAYDADIRIDLEKGSYELADVMLQIEETPFTAKGIIHDRAKKGWDVDMTVRSEKGNLGDVFGVLPRSMFAKLQGLESKGKFQTELVVKGTYLQDKEQPQIDLSFGMEDGRITTDVLRNPFKDVSFTAKYSNGKNRSLRSSSFALSKFRGYFDKELIDVNLEVENFEVPYINLQMDGVLAGEAIASLLNQPHISGGRGELELNNIDIRGRYQDMIKATRAEGVKTSGELEFDDLSLEINKKSIRLDRGIIRFQGNDYQVEDLHLEGPDTDIKLEGSCKNLLPVFLADSLNSQQAELTFSGKLEADEIDIDQLLSLSGAPVTTTEGTAPETEEGQAIKQAYEGRSRITSFLDGSFEANVKSFNYRELKGERFKGTLTFQNNTLEYAGEAQAMGGLFDIEGKGYFSQAPYVTMKLICEDVDVNEFFRQNEEFYQEVLTSENLEGRMDAKIAVEAHWTPEGVFNMDDLVVLADVNIKNGELRDFEMLYEYSKYFKQDELRRIKFNELQNWIEIKNSTIFIPVMFIQSSAMNLTISGEHTFNHDMHYYFKINAGQVLAGKLKGKDKKMDMVPTKRKDWFNLYMHLFGNIDDYEYNTKGKEVKAHFKRTDQRKEYIKQRLIRFFGPIINLDEPVSWKDDIPEYPENTEPDEEPEYIEGFD